MGIMAQRVMPMEVPLQKTKEWEVRLVPYHLYESWGQFVISRNIIVNAVKPLSPKVPYHCIKQASLRPGLFIGIVVLHKGCKVYCDFVEDDNGQYLYKCPECGASITIDELLDVIYTKENV